MENLDQWDHLDHLAKEVFQACLAFLVLRVIVVSPVSMEQKEAPVELVKREKWVLVDHLDHRDQ